MSETPPPNKRKEESSLSTDIGAYEAMRDAEVARISGEMERTGESPSALVRMRSLFGNPAPDSYYDTVPIANDGESEISLRTSALSIDDLKKKIVRDRGKGGDKIQTVRDLKFFAKQGGEEEDVEARRKRARSDADCNWFTDAGGIEYFYNFLRRHRVVAKENSASDVAGASRQSTRSAMAAASTKPRTLVHPWHNGFYLFEAMTFGELRERPCVNGEDCVARICMPHPEADPTEQERDAARAREVSESNGVAPNFSWNPNPPRGGVILKEFLDERERAMFVKRGELPSVHGPCVVCMRNECFVDRFFSELQIVGGCDPPHHNPVDVRGGYRREACLQWSRGGQTHGAILHMRHFDASEYNPTTLDEALDKKCIGLLSGEENMLKVAARLDRRGPGKGGYPKARGYLEDGSVYYFQVSRWLSPQAASLGMEPQSTYVPAMALQAPPPGILSLMTERTIEDDPIPRSFSHLAKEASSRTGYDLEALTIVLGQFGSACVAVRTCLRKEEAGREKLSWTERSIVDVIRSQRTWSRFRAPTPLSKHSILSTLSARNGIVEDVRRSVANDAVSIARRNAMKRRKVAEVQRQKSASTSSAPLPEEGTFPRMTLAQSDIGARKSSTKSGEATKKTDGSSRSRQPSQKQMDRALASFSRLWISQKPATRWFVAAIAGRMPVEDMALVGKEWDSAADVAIAMGEMYPDVLARQPEIHPTDPEPHTSDPPIVRLTYPSHRDAIVTWLSDVGNHYDFGSGLDARFDEAIAELGGTEFAEIGSDLKVRDVLREFWETARIIASSGHDSKILEVCSDHVIPGWMREGEKKSESPGSLSMAAAVAARTRLADLLVSKALRPDVAYRTHAFAWTHADLALAIDWSGGSPTTDAELTSIRVPGSRACVAEVAYPSDSRCCTVGETPSLAALMAQCGFFEQSDPSVAKSATHAIGKTVPRACQSRESNSVTSQACLECREYARFVASSLDLTLRGGYPHAKTRPPFATCLSARRMVKNIERDIYARADAIAAKGELARYSEGVKRIAAASKRYSPEAIDAALIAADAFSEVSEAVGGILNGSLSSPFGDAAAAVRRVVADAIAIEIYREVASRSVPEDVRRLFATDAYIASRDAEAASEGRRPTTRDESISDKIRAVVSTKIVASRSAYRAVLGALGDPSDARLITILNEISDAFPGSDRESRKSALAGALSHTFSVLSFGGACGGDSLTRPRRSRVPAMVEIAKEAVFAYTSTATKAHLDLPTDRDSFVEKILAELEIVSDSTLTETEFRTLAIGDVSVRSTIKSALKRVFEKEAAEKSERRAELVAERASEDSVSAVGRAIAGGLSHVVMDAIAECAPRVRDVAEVCVNVLSRLESKHGSDTVSRCASDLVRSSFAATIIENTFSSPKLRSEWSIAVTRAEMIAIAENARRRRLAPPFSEFDPKVPSGSVNPVSYYGVCDEHEWTQMREGLSKSDAIAALDGKPLSKSMPMFKGLPDCETDISIISERAACVVYDVISDAATLAEHASDYSKAVTTCCDTERGAKECIASKLRSPGASFVESSPTLLHYVVRESGVAAQSHNPALVTAFCKRGPWFPEFMDHVCDVADWIRERLECGAIPTESELSEHAEEERRKKWGDHVFRLYKHCEPTRFAKILSQIESAMRKLGIYANSEIDGDKRRLMWEFLSAEHAAHGSSPEERPHDHRRDLETMWRFGMRDHGLSVLAKMHRSYVAFGGSNELTKIAEGLSAAEFELASMYYDLFSRANAAKVRPLRSRSWSESSMAALCAKHCVPDGSAVPEQLTQLFVCDSCRSIVTQITPRTSRPSNMSSCFGTASDSSGRNVCADRRNLSKKRAAASSAEECSEDKVKKTDGDADVPEQRKRPRPPSLFSWTVPCQDTRTRTIPGVGSVVEFETKFSSISEKSGVSKLPCILTPCCGQFTRYLPDDECELGYECLACSTSRGAERTLPPTCAACGRPTSTTKTAEADDQLQSAYAPRASEETRALYQRRYDELFNSGCSTPEDSLRVGSKIPISPAAPGTALAFDDFVSFAVMPVDLCAACMWHPQVRRGEWPVMLSSILEFSKHRKEEEAHRVMFNGGGYYSHADPNYSKKKRYHPK